MSDLDKGALMKILTEPKNALLKQYQRLFEFETSVSASPMTLSIPSRSWRFSAKSARAACV